MLPDFKLYSSNGDENSTVWQEKIDTEIKETELRVQE